MRITTFPLAGGLGLILAVHMTSTGHGQPSPGVGATPAGPEEENAEETAKAEEKTKADAEEKAEADGNDEANRNHEADRKDEADRNGKAGEADKKDRDKAKGRKKKTRDIDVGGRVFVRDTVTRSDWRNDLTVDSARIGVEYRARDLGLEIEVDIELADREAEIRDGYLRIEPNDWLRVQAGRFKVPISAVALESKWDLPVIERGVVSDLELANENTDEPDRLPLGGRSEGVSVRVRGRDLRFDPRLTVGVFRGAANQQLEESLAGNRAPITLSDGFPEDLYSRIEIEPTSGVRVGASFAWFTYLGTAGTRDTFKHGLVGSLDAVVESGPLRLWLEGFGGTSPIHFGLALRSQGQFWATRLIASARFDARCDGFVYIEPHLAAQLLDASTGETDDRARQIAAGVNLGWGESWRLQLAAEHLDVDAKLVGAGTRLITQLGAVF